MVPYRKILRAIALAAHCAPNPAVALEQLCKLHAVQFPCTAEEFWKREVIDFLPPELEALFLTTDANTTSDYRPMFAAATALGVAAYICVSGSGPTVVVPADVLKWRKQQPIRVALETMLLCGISTAQISEDFRRMYQQTFAEDDVRLFGDLYVDRDFAAGDNWVLYTEAIGQGEATFKYKLMQQPHDYVRWQLGVPVSLEAEQVLNRMMSDSYYTCQQLKAETNNEPSKDQLNRIKMERETIFKAMDRLTKHKESSGGSGTNKAAEEIRKIVLDYAEEAHQSMGDLTE